MHYQLQPIANTKPSSCEHKKLIVLHNFTSLETCGYILKQLQEASTDIIIVNPLQK